MTADPVTHEVIATVNEDANSSVYTIAPWAPAGHQVRHYALQHPAAEQGWHRCHHHLPWHGPDQRLGPRDHRRGRAAAGLPGGVLGEFDPASLVATVHPLFYDESAATVVNAGSGHPQAKLALTDPDSNEGVPGSAPRFAGDFMLTSQGDQEQIYLQRAGQRRAAAAGAEADPVGRRHCLGHQPGGRLYAADTSGDTIDVVTGWFTPGNCVRGGHPVRLQQRARHVPGPGFPANYLGLLSPRTGQITRVPVHGVVPHPAGHAVCGAGAVTGR